MAKIIIRILLSFWLSTIPAYAQEHGKGQPFAWDRDQLWSQLELRFVTARAQDCQNLQPDITDGVNGLNAFTASNGPQPLAPSAPVWDETEHLMLSLGPLLAACPSQLPAYVESVARLRNTVKRQTERWPAQAPETRRRLYRFIYGGRMAIEEILLQAQDSVPALWQEASTLSATPSVEIHGVTLYSGDMLVSRGGSATSALIARGSDYPGNFSHVSLLHVDDATGKASVIEALIETGVQIHTVEDYIKDKKFRIMVLRLRPDLAALRDPGIAHQAAQWAFEAAGKEKIDYDFEMDFRNHDKLFCAEVIYAAYEKVGITLWTGLSHISAEGTARWLEGLGVKNFITLEPSDLEYDPQLVRVAEWRDPASLFEDHVHNAVTDAMLEGANAGDPISYNRLMLPVAWGLKTYSALKNQFGGAGPIPKGMDTKAALRSKWYSKEHEQRVKRMMLLVDQFRQTRGYNPPYWELFRLARQAK